jgi:hypothetical protein
MRADFYRCVSGEAGCHLSNGGVYPIKPIEGGAALCAFQQPRRRNLTRFIAIHHEERVADTQSARVTMR